MYVSDFMSQTAAVRQDLDSGTAFQLMEEQGLDFLPVIDGSENVVGVLSRLHADRAFARYQSTLAEIGDIMDCAFGSVTPNTPLAEAAQQMVADRSSVILVTDVQGHQLGLLTSSDLHRALVRMLRGERGVSHHAA